MLHINRAGRINVEFLSAQAGHFLEKVNLVGCGMT